MHPQQMHTGARFHSRKGAIQEAFDWPFCSEPFPLGNGSCSLSPNHSKTRWRNRVSSDGKVSLAMVWLSAYHRTCLVNRLWVPTIV